MADAGRLKTIAEIIDRLESIREELMVIQRRLEKMEHIEAPEPPPSRRGKPGPHAEE